MFAEEPTKPKLKWKSTVTIAIQCQEQCLNVECQTAQRKARPKMHQMYIIIKHILKDREKNLKANCDFICFKYLACLFNECDDGLGIWAFGTLT